MQLTKPQCIMVCLNPMHFKEHKKTFQLLLFLFWGNRWEAKCSISLVQAGGWEEEGEITAS